MSDGVKWIHITADVFDNWKIKHIKAMPEVGHTLVCIWFELLCLAGQCNHPSGLIVMSERFIISEEMIASTFNEDIRMVKLALKTFEECGMIQITDSKAIQISNWFEYQNEAGLTQIREYEAEKKAKTRAKKKLAIEDKKVSMDKSTDKSMTSPCFSSLSISNSKVLVNSKKENINNTNNSKKKSNKEVRYFEDDDLNNTFADFVEMRNATKEPMTDRAVTIAKKRINEYAKGNKQVAIAIIEQSILNNWKGIYPLKSNTNTAISPQQPKKVTEADRKALDKIIMGE